jgi:hydroxymethylpyrimidine pyrophosphatase-like HAD family hydrolase
VENTIAVGDQWNDIPMIEAAGLGAAVANADNKLKAAADVVLNATNEQGAVGEVITRFAYQKED